MRKVLTAAVILAFISQIDCRAARSIGFSPDDLLEQEAFIKVHNINTLHRERRSTEDATVTHKEKRVMVIRVSSNLTFYIELKPQNDSTLHGKLNSVDVVHDNRTESHKLVNLHDVEACQFKGTVIAPVQGVASVNTCPNSTEAYAILITDNGVFYLKPKMIEWKGKDDRPHVFTKIQSNTDEQFCGVHTFEEDIPLDDAGKVAPSTDVPLGTSDEEFETTTKPAFPDEMVFKFGKDEENIIVKSRKRRAAEGGVKYIETGVFVDRHMYDAIAKSAPADTVKAIVGIVMAILHQVQLIYDYQSMTAFNFKLVIVKFEILRNTKTSPSTGGGNIDKYLDTFCSWQCKRLPATGKPDHWDHAIMLTGLDMFKMAGNTKNDKVLGLAWVNGMCRCDYSCTINEGNSAEAAFVIAHEMGHSLGMQHDGSGNKCDSNKYIMSDRTGAGKVNWSKCSNDYVKAAERKGQYKCLANGAKPATDTVDIDKLGKLPGQDYSAAQQCQMALTPKHKPYMQNKSPFNDICRELWCLEGSWATPAHPALDGTECASGKWCRQGSCITKGEHSKSETTKPPQTAATQSGATTSRKVTAGAARRRVAFKNLYGRYSSFYG